MQLQVNNNITQSSVYQKLKNVQTQIYEKQLIDGPKMSTSMLKQFPHEDCANFQDNYPVYM